MAERPRPRSTGIMPVLRRYQPTTGRENNSFFAMNRIASAILARRTVARGSRRPLTLELPTYRWPSLRTAVLTMADRGLGFLRKAGTVILQTLHPDHAALDMLLREGYEAYARWLLRERSLAGLPPCGFQALLRADAHERDHVRQFLNEAAGCFPAGQARLFGPLPAIMERVGGRTRMYLVLQSAERSGLHAQLDAWLPGVRALPSARRVRWSIDVDPQEL